MRKRLLFIFLFTVAYFVGFAQNESYKLLKCIDTTGNRIVTDNLGNIYLLEKSSLKKYDAEGNFLCSYTELSDGMISGIDVSDPLKIIIINSDFGKIKFLDNKLSIRNTPVSLSNLGYPNASLAAASYESGFWVFDPLSNQLIRFDNDLQLSQSSGNISDLIGHAFKPDLIIESGNMVYVKEGDKVKKGDKLLILEAMKMNNELTTLVNGKVKKVYCKTGEMVTKSQILVEIG